MWVKWRNGEFGRRKVKGRNNRNGQGSIYMKKQGKEVMAFLGVGIGIAFFVMSGQM